MNKKIIGLIGVLFFFIVVIMTSCHQVETEDESGIVDQERGYADSLDVFLVSDKVSTYDISTDKRGEYYTTMFSLGEYSGNTVEFGSAGFVFEKAIEEYSKKTGTKINLHWYEWPELMEADLEKLSEEEMPDLILCTNATDADYYKYMREGVFLDLSDYMTAEEIYGSDIYYEKILDAGIYDKKQYILPIMFNISTIMGSEIQLDKLGIYYEEVVNLEGVLDSLIDAQQNAELYEVVEQFDVLTGYYLAHILYTAAGNSWVDYQNNEVILDEALFKKIAVFYKGYVEEQFENIKMGERIPWENSLHVETKRLVSNEYNDGNFMVEMLPQFGCIVEGGSAGQTELHSAAAEAYYFESRYNDLEENFVLAPLVNGEGGITAHVTYFGAVMDTTDTPEDAYIFLRYLMDADWSFTLGLSVNKEHMNKQLDDMTITIYTLYPGLRDAGTGVIDDNVYSIQPMSKKTKEIIENMLDSITIVTLPNWTAYSILQDYMDRYATGEITLDDAYNNAYHDLGVYVEMPLLQNNN